MNDLGTTHDQRNAGGNTMTRSTILSVLVAILFIGAFAPVASAHYDPATGRWLERDPLGTRPSVPRIGQYPSSPMLGNVAPASQYNDGMHLYEYVQSLPTVLVDLSGLELRFATRKEEKLFLDIANRLCPEGNWKVKDPWGKNNRRLEPKDSKFCTDYEENQGWGCQSKPPLKKKRKADSSSRPTICGCLCDAINSPGIITLNQRRDPGGHVVTPGFDELYLGPGFPGGIGGGYASPGDRPPRMSPGMVLADQDIIFAHELCCHAVPRVPHPPVGHPDRYTVRDPVIICENNIRRELGPGYGERH